MIFCLPDAVEEAAARHPDREAIRCRERSLTYAEFADSISRLASALVEQGVRRGDRVGIYMDKSLECAVALYGIMKAGAAYVPLDPSSPVSRLEYVIHHCGIRRLVSENAKAKQLERLAQASGSPLECVLGVGEETDIPCRRLPWNQIASFPPLNGEVGVIDQDLAYIIYTSGSTGEPKGIMHTHSSALSFARWARALFDLRAEDRLTNHAPLHFDLSTFDFFSGALAGSTTVIVTEEYLKLPASYSQLLEREGITVFYTVPFALIQLLTRGALEKRDLSALRWVIFGGEPFPVKHLRELMIRLPSARFTNLYGPAEVNGCTYYHVPPLPEDRDEPLSIGMVWRNAQSLIVDDNDQAVSPGSPGELLIRSGTMMQGYWARPDLNERAYFRRETQGIQEVYYRTGDLVAEMPDGNLKFLGRMDRQIKLRGYRIELDEIEAALLAYPTVEEAAVFLIPAEDNDHNIIAAVTVGRGRSADPMDIVQHAKHSLPWYAVPHMIRIESAFPRTSSGKIARRELRDSLMRSSNAVSA